MRICHVIESACGGSAAILASLALHAVRHGHQVHVVYSPDRADEKLIQLLRSCGCASINGTPMKRSVGAHDAVDGLRLRKLLGSLGPIDVIHSHSSKAGALARTVGRLRNTAQVYSPHGFYTMTGEAPFYVGLVERMLSLVTDRIVAVSQYEKRHAVEIGIDPRRVSVVPNGVAPFAPWPREHARRELGLDRAAFVVGFVGRLAAQKDPEAAVRAIAAVPRNVDVQLAMVGEGPLKASAQRLATENGARVVFAGAREARPLFSAFDCLLCTSRYEGMPVAFLESLTCGVPIISYPVGGTEELVIPGKTGLITDPDAQSAARAIQTLAEMSPTASREISSACREVASSYSDEAMGDATLAVYREVLRGNQAG